MFDSPSKKYHDARQKYLLGHVASSVSGSVVNRRHSGLWPLKFIELFPLSQRVYEQQPVIHESIASLCGTIAKAPYWRKVLESFSWQSIWHYGKYNPPHAMGFCAGLIFIETKRAWMRDWNAANHFTSPDENPKEQRNLRIKNSNTLDFPPEYYNYPTTLQDESF